MDMATLTNPTLDSRERASTDRTVEEIAWPEKAKVVALMGHGFGYDEARHMSIADYRRYMAIIHAWSIPADRRVGVRMATAADAPLA